MTTASFTCLDIHKGTSISSDGKTVNQIDHVIVNSRSYSSIVKVRSYRGADCNSDHYLTRAELRERIVEAKEKSVAKNITFKNPT